MGWSMKPTCVAAIFNCIKVGNGVKLGCVGVKERVREGVGELENYYANLRKR